MPPPPGSVSTRVPCVQALALQELALLHDHFDGLTLGMELPGCYNPSCLDLHALTEETLPTKPCYGCRLARWGAARGRAAALWGAVKGPCWGLLRVCGAHSPTGSLCGCRYCSAECAKAHWKLHKPSCREAAAQRTAAGAEAAAQRAAAGAEAAGQPSPRVISL